MLASPSVSSLRASGMRHSALARRSACTLLPQGGRRLAAAATPADQNSSNGAADPSTSTIFYGGQSYSEAEWKDALANGRLGAPVAMPASLSSRSTSAITFNDAMGFSGAVPEKANGRLAMLGFISAVGAELATGEPVLKQLAEEPTGIVAVFVLFIAASLVPAFAGRKEETVGPFTPQAEMTNGRAAMLGFAAMLVIEAVKGSALF